MFSLLFLRCGGKVSVLSRLFLLGMQKPVSDQKCRRSSEEKARAPGKTLKFKISLIFFPRLLWGLFKVKTSSQSTRPCLKATF